MIGQQRNILAAIGIDIWIPKDVVCEKKTAAHLWRDQVVDNRTPIEEISFASDLAEAHDLEQPTISEPIVEVQSQPQEITPKPIIREATTAKPQIVVEGSVQSFELQMYVLENCSILVESSQLNAEQQQLWQNIQKAKLGYYAELKWPFPLAEFQDSRGLPSYIQGFLDATSNNKKILCLGKLEFIQHSNILYLASLEEMITQPLLKKRLWQLMQ
ncbi:hypothetical protein [Acinetobacter junii]|uniref:hypothetical protein n=1 Tax=Acinetobacter junii TaxID=40215 RepID=UPI00143C73E8|nr:hypothetical protein [Acinetobacter junii]NKG33837.1 hypothetical protein [Acinetobacter junii]